MFFNNPTRPNTRPFTRKHMCAAWHTTSSFWTHRFTSNVTVPMKRCCIRLASVCALHDERHALCIAFCPRKKHELRKLYHRIHPSSSWSREDHNKKTGPGITFHTPDSRREISSASQAPSVHAKDRQRIATTLINVNMHFQPSSSSSRISVRNSCKSANVKTKSRQATRLRTAAVKRCKQPRCERCTKAAASSMCLEQIMRLSHMRQESASTHRHLPQDSPLQHNHPGHTDRGLIAGVYVH